MPRGALSPPSLKNDLVQGILEKEIDYRLLPVQRRQEADGTFRFGPMISISSLGMSFGDRTLFTGVSIQLNRGERYGLVGANGSGKTTLLNVLSGELAATEGHASIPKDARLGVLRQDHYKHEHQRIVDVAMMGNLRLWQALEEREKILADAEEDFDAHRFAEV